MEALFKKYFWVIKTLGIAAACGLAASAVTTQIGSMMLFDSPDAAQQEGETDGETDGDEGGDEDEGKTKSKGFSFDESAFGAVDSSQRVKAKNLVADEIRKRNIFCPGCQPEQPEEAAASTGGDAAAGAGGSGSLIQPGETKSKLPLRLMATMEAEDPSLSFATILDEENGFAGLYGRGDEVRSGVVVTGVDQALVHLRNNATLEYIELGDEVPPPPRSSSASTSQPSTTKPKNDRSIPGAEEAINCPSEHTCVVERAFVEQLMANPAMLAKQARIVPKQKDDEVLGYKLYGIRRGSLPKLLGLKNGDMVKAVNGEEIKGMDKAMALFTKLRHASNLSVSIERKGKMINKEIQIQ